MRILVAGTSWPSRQHRFVHGENMILFELLAGLAGSGDVQVAYLHVREGERVQGDVGQARNELEPLGISVLDPVVFPDRPKSRPLGARVRSLVAPHITDYYPVCRQREKVHAIVRSWRADAIVIALSEALTALFSECPVPVKYAYYSNPDPKNYAANLRINERLSENGSWASRCLAPARRWLGNRRVQGLEKVHLDVLRQYDLVGEIAHNDMMYYRGQGIPAHYVRHVWYDLLGDAVHEAKRAAELPENRIIGNVGTLNATANTYGLELLAREVVPALKRRLGPGGFAVHILGGGKALPFVDQALRAHPEIVVRGFVDDIDAELQKAKVFLVANNGTSYQVGHTRYFTAWGLGCCVVAFADAALSIPEIVDGHNALLGRDADEVAEQVQLALQDEPLRRRIAANGYRTFKDFFTRDAVAHGIIKDLRRQLDRKAA